MARWVSELRQQAIGKREQNSWKRGRRGRKFGETPGSCSHWLLRRAYEAGVVGGDDQLGAVARTELREQAADVGLGRGQADMQVGCDLGVGQPESYQGEDLAFPLG